MNFKPFLYLPTLDCFVIRKDFRELCDRLQISEWNAVVWMGRLFARDQDFGEHWFDNWDEREKLAEEAKKLGYDEEELLIVVPDNFTEGHQFCVYCFDKNEAKPIKEAVCPSCGEGVNVSPDGPCYSDNVKKRFWTDVLDSMTISIHTLFTLAREEAPKTFDVEREINQIKQELKEQNVWGFNGVAENNKM